MKIARAIQELEDAKNALGAGRIAYVPTMGALHEGHLSLVRLAKENADHVIVSIFVNPTQFAPDEDFDSYPRTEEADAALLEAAGADVLFLPTEAVIYPDGTDCTIVPGDNAQGLEATFRPTHFAGVVNVVSRLFDAVKPDVAVFGQKDFQQLQVIRQMVDSEAIDIEIIGAPIARDEFGLALSSRNLYLSDEELMIARQFNVIMRQAARDGDLETAKRALLEAGFDKVDYIEKRWNRVLGAAWLGKTRLIDNMAVDEATNVGACAT
ncbi:MAG: pantoate--beta-alanine ligase [Alphaproteobacteria bacterium]